jgi:hypothetical protein
LRWLAVVMTAAIAGGHVAARFGQPAVLGRSSSGAYCWGICRTGGAPFLGSNSYLDPLSGSQDALLLFGVGLGLSDRDLSVVGPSCCRRRLGRASRASCWGLSVGKLRYRGAARRSPVPWRRHRRHKRGHHRPRVLRDTNASRTRDAKIILGAAVVDDVLALILIGAVTAGPCSWPVERFWSIRALAIEGSASCVLSVSLGAWLTRPGSAIRSG